MGDEQRHLGSEELLIRIDERTQAMASDLKGVKESSVSRAEFNPVKSIAYGLVGLVLTAVIIAIVSQVLVHR